MFSRCEARSLALGRGDLRGLVRSGVIRRILNDVYASADIPDTQSLRAAALARVVPEGALVCRRTAAWLYGVDAMAIGAHQSVPPVEVVVPLGATPPRRPGCEGYVADLLSEDVEIVVGVPVTSPVRTGVDLARYLPRTDAVVAIDAITHAGLAGQGELLDALPRWAGERNVRRAEEVIELSEPKTESPMESRTRLRVVDAGFPRPVAQLEFRQNGVLIFRLDLALEGYRAGFEYDGEIHERQREYDEARRAWFERRGWTILSFGKGEVLSRGHQLELAVGEVLGIRPRFRTPVPGWG